MSEKRIVITGSIRSASTWLADMFQKNVIAPHVDFRHEAFSFHLLKTIKKWKKGPDGVYGSVGHDHVAMPIIERALHPTWAFIWRDPAELIASILGWQRRNKRRPHTTGEIAFRIFYLFAGWNAALVMADTLKIKPTHWHFDNYTKPEGFKTMAASFGLKLRDPLIGASTKSRNATPGKLRQKPGDLEPPLKGYISELMTEFPRVRGAIDMSRSRGRIAS